jgi:hypothetical protein
MPRFSARFRFGLSGLIVDLKWLSIKPPAASVALIAESPHIRAAMVYKLSSPRRIASWNA